VTTFLIKIKYYFYTASGIKARCLFNSRKKHALSRKDGKDNQNSKIKVFDCTLRAAIG